METPGTSQPYAPNVPAVAHESFDDEVVLIHFPSGRYFRLDAVGLAAWRALEAPGGADVNRVADVLGRRFDAAAETIRDATERFLAELCAHELVVTANGAPRDGEAGHREDEPEAKAPFQAPRLEVFTDLEDLLLLDPIHDVDETGWPHAQT